MLISNFLTDNTFMTTFLVTQEDGRTMYASGNTYFEPDLPSLEIDCVGYFSDRISRNQYFNYTDTDPVHLSVPRLDQNGVYRIEVHYVRWGARFHVDMRLQEATATYQGFGPTIGAGRGLALFVLSFQLATGNPGP